MLVLLLLHVEQLCFSTDKRSLCNTHPMRQPSSIDSEREPIVPTLCTQTLACRRCLCVDSPSLGQTRSVSSAFLRLPLSSRIHSERSLAEEPELARLASWRSSNYSPVGNLVATEVEQEPYRLFSSPATGGQRFHQAPAPDFTVKLV